MSQLLAKTVLAELAVRRGDADAESGSRTSPRQADRAGDLQRRPVLELQIEWALTRGGPMPLERFDAVVEKYEPQRRLTAGAARGSAPGPPSPASTASRASRSPRSLAAMARRDWQAAADAFGAVGWSYDRALMLSLLDDEASLTEAIEIARETRCRAARAARGRGGCASSA